MKFNNIFIYNFRQYFGSVPVDLETSPGKNVILIGGKNGYGKTNFLLAIVWCLYGDKISKIDENFKKEIQKDKNYSNFITGSLNYSARKNNNNNFFVEISVRDLDLPAISGFPKQVDTVKIKREFDVVSMKETLSIVEQETGKELFSDLNDKIGFIDDYVIPLDAAKFVFFDAEKISEIANLSKKEEGSFLNDALGKILGLDIYETLIEDFNFYKDTLKRKGADTGLNGQLLVIENSQKVSKNEIDHHEEDIAEKEKQIEELKREVNSYNGLISQHSKQGDSTIDRGKIISDLTRFKEQEKELEAQFSELSEIIPLAILTGKLEEVNEHLEIQTQNEIGENSESINSEKIEAFLERLFNQPPQPQNSTMNAMEKFFYMDKAKELGSEIFGEQTAFRELEFEHDLSNAEKSLIKDGLNLVNSQSKNIFKKTIEDLNSIKNEINQLERILSKVEADLEDELILEYTSEKETRENTITQFNQEIGIKKERIKTLKEEIARNSRTYQSRLKEVSINQQNKKKIAKCEEYSGVLKDFVQEQKAEKKESLAKSILEEMQNLMHKLSENKNQFVTNVKVTLLAEGNGMIISLYNAEGDEIKKETLAAGEKQIYISSLIKAILKESVRDLPIFIDTPLGRLDSEHRDNITNKYYPNLSGQVVLFSTNSEITPRRFKEIESFVSSSYLLVNDGANTEIKRGYFKTVSND